MNSVFQILSQTHPTYSAATPTDNVSVPETPPLPPTIPQLTTMLQRLEREIATVLTLLQTFPGISSKEHTANIEPLRTTTSEQIIEGVFTGVNMVGPDGNTYPVPPNYASKSKLVEGDIMKLTITAHGSFMYKQIGPIERIRVMGELISSTAADWHVLANGKKYKILYASVTFYKGSPGDQVIILIPKDSDSSWGAVENIIHQ